MEILGRREQELPVAPARWMARLGLKDARRRVNGNVFTSPPVFTASRFRRGCLW
jgi:hypothetical protein